MRKIAFILALLCCLVGFSNRDALRVHRCAEPAAALVGRASDLPVVLLSSGCADNDRLRCQREYNSDLNLPRPAPDVHPQSVTLPQLRNANPVFGRKAQHLAAARAAGLLKATCSFVRDLLSAVPHGVDYYVYRLRRLII